MVDIKFNKENTKGKYDSAFEFIDAEIKKDNEIVATDIPDLYDVDVTYPVTDGNVLKYNSSTQLWEDGIGGEGACNLISGYLYISSSGTANGTGTIDDPFDTFNTAFKYLNENCKVISEDEYLNLITNDQITTLYEPVLMNHPYGHRINIIFNNFWSKLIITYKIDVDSSLNIISTPTINNFKLTNGHSINNISWIRSFEVLSIINSPIEYYVNEFLESELVPPITKIDLGKIYAFEINNNCHISFSDIIDSNSIQNYTGISLTPDGPWNVLFNEKRHVLCENNSSFEWNFLLDYKTIFDIKKQSLLSIINDFYTQENAVSLPKINLSYKSLIEYNSLATFSGITTDVSSMKVRNGVIE